LSRNGPGVADRRIVFLGTPGAAVPALERLAARLDLVVTRPDRRQGRNRQLVPSAVSSAADRLGLPVAKPEDRAELSAVLAPQLRLGVVVAFGMLLPQAILDSSELGFLNLHFSLLPRWRGAAPVQRSIMAGDQFTGVTVFRLDGGLDHGPLLASFSTEIRPVEKGTELLARLATLGAELLVDTVARHLAGETRETPQIEADATPAPKLTPDDQHLRLTATPIEWELRVRALADRPGAFCLYEGSRLKLLAVSTVSDPPGLAPGELSLRDDRLMCGLTDGAVELVEVQPVGKRPMSGSDWARGRHGHLGRLD